MFSGAVQSHSYIYAQGEMADRTRAFEWANTSLGDVSLWPSPLLTTVNLILDSAFPMFIWWGTHKIQFYNDAYLKILGTDEKSKHPKALGQMGVDCWPEIWPVINPLLERVLETGEPVFMEDQLIPIYRQGKLDDVYWTFSYNIIRDTGGAAGGILVVCTETTQKVTFQQKVAAVNEELASSNEELLSTNEELSLSQQSLKTLNNELEERVNLRTAELQNAHFDTHEQKQRLSHVIREVPAGLAILSGKEMTLEMANDYMLNFWGKDASIIGQPLLSFLPELKEQAFPDLLNTVYTTGNQFVTQDAPVEIARDGKLDLSYMDFSYTPLKDPLGVTSSILVLATDVTERTLSRRREQKLTDQLGALNEEIIAANEELSATIDDLATAQQLLQDNFNRIELSEGRFQNLVEDATVGIIVLLGDEFKVAIVNAAYGKLIGRTVEELYQQRLFDIVPESEADFRAVIEQVRITGEAVHLYDAPYFAYANGNKISGYLNLVYQPFRDADGSVIGTMVLCQDVTEQFKAKQELEANEKRFRFMLNAIPQQVWTAQPDGALDYVNENVSNDFGQSREHIVGFGWQAFIHPEDLPKAITAWQYSLQTGNEYQIEFRLKFKDDNYYWHLARALPLVENEKIQLWLGTNTNIELQKSNEQRKDEFLSIASHELKTPLTSIKAFNQIIGRLNQSDKVKEFVTRSADHIIRLEKLINDLLDVTKINAGKLNYNMQPFSFDEMVAESIESIQHTNTKHKIILESSAAVTFNGDRFRLEQVMNNFLSNAVKYSPQGEKIIVNSKEEDGSIVVSVQDFGIGIPEEGLDKLFDRYYRVDNTAMRFEGLGLGLFICSEILKRHGGSFWIESKEGEGSTFYFRLPLRQEETMTNLQDGDSRTFYKDSTISIKFNALNQRLDVDWTGFQTLQSVQDGCMKMLEMLTQNKCRKVVNDNRHVLGTWSEAAEWVGKSWFPMMENAGLQYFAWIFSPSAFSQLSAKKSIDVKEGSVITQFFTEIKSAEMWIDSCSFVR
jgi:PAS domain S-box-containing protein